MRKCNGWRGFCLFVILSQPQNRNAGWPTGALARGAVSVRLDRSRSAPACGNVPLRGCSADRLGGSRKSLLRNVRQSASEGRPHGLLVEWMRGCRQAGTFRTPPRQIRIPREVGPLWSSSKSPRDYMPQLGGCELALKVNTPIPKALLLGQASGFRRSRRTPAAAFTRHVARPAKHRPVTPRLERHSRRLATTRTNHRGSLRRSRTVAGISLGIFLCLSARSAALGSRVTTFLKERLIGSAEGEFLPTVAASNLHISGHRSPYWGIVQPFSYFPAKILFKKERLTVKSQSRFTD